MSSTTTYEAGQVVVVEVAFSDHSGAKRRPALVVSTSTFHANLLDLVVCPISSQPGYHKDPGSGDYPLKHWKKVGLRHASTVRVSKILAVDKKIVGRTLGMLADDDLEPVRHRLRDAFGL
jgi:mRNA interferase MazF